MLWVSCTPSENFNLDDMSDSLPQQRVIITGASSGIGRATALAFAQRGFAVALLGRSPTRLAAVTEQILSQGGQAQAYTLDLTDWEQLPRQFTAIATEWGIPDILVNSAGIGYTNSLKDTSLQDWQKILDTNVTSIFQTMQAVLPAMRQRGQGTIINLLSIAATKVFPNWGAYCVSKAALMTLTKAFALEEQAQGIRIMAISPGSVNTPIWDTDTVQADFDRTQMLTPETVAQVIVQAALLPPDVVIEEMTIMSNAGIL